MENASKALLIAGGILIAILIIGLLMYLVNSIGNLTAEADEKQRIEQITAFNKQYEVYQRQVLRGNDVASVINKIRDNNKKYIDNPELQITWQFDLKRGILNVLPEGTYTEANKTIYNNVVNNATNFRDFKSLYFKCTSIEYSNTTGQVNKIVFEEILYEDLFN